MDEAERGHLETLRQTHLRSLRALEEQTAKYGLAVPTYIINEIEDRRQKLVDIERQLGIISAPPLTTPPSASSTAGSTSSTAPSTPLELFFSYAHEDEVLRDKLAKQLRLLERQGIIAGWHDRRISAGTEWAGQIDSHLDSARIILLLISADFLASDYCYDVELKRALERHIAGSARVIPVILRPCDWHSTPFGKLQALPKDGKAITTWLNEDEAFLDVAHGIRRVAEELGRRVANAATQALETYVERNLAIEDAKMRDIARAAVEPQAAHMTEKLGLIREHIVAEPRTPEESEREHSEREEIVREKTQDKVQRINKRISALSTRARWIGVLLVVALIVGLIGAVRIVPQSIARYSATQTAARILVNRTGRIAFSSIRDGNNTEHIYTMNADGSGLNQLTRTSPGRDNTAIWSPDGLRIAFFSNKVTSDGATYIGEGDIYVMNADGSRRNRLTNKNNAATSSTPAWSPDGSRIAFATSELSSDGKFYVGDIYVINADGSGLTRLTNNPGGDWNPAWSPDGSRIAFSSYRNGNIDIYVMNVDGSGQTQLTNDSKSKFYPTWSPDGSRIAFVTLFSNGDYDNIYVINKDGSQLNQLTDSSGANFTPAWSPDSARIAFVSKRDSNDEIYVMNADGSQQTRLTNNPGDDLNPAWSPDGRLIAFERSSGDDKGICVMNVDGTEQVHLPNTSFGDSLPVWKPS